MPQTRKNSRDAALVELQRLHAAILASRERRGATASDMSAATAAATRQAAAAQELTRRLQTTDAPVVEAPAATAPTRRIWWIAVAAAVVLAGTWATRSLTQRSEVVTEAAPKGAPTEAPADTGAGAAPRAAATAPTPARPVEVTLQTIRPVWLLITADGKRVHRGTVEAGQTLSFAADRAVVVRSGDAGGVRTTLNGSDRGPLGLRGWPLTVAITPTGIEPLTPTRPEP